MGSEEGLLVAPGRSASSGGVADLVGHLVAETSVLRFLGFELLPIDSRG